MAARDNVSGLSQLEIDNLGKRYWLDPPRDRRAQWRSNAAGARLVSQFAGVASAGILGLRDVTTTIAPGTILGIIGPNGAGKTTLLKVLARVTMPTEGRAIGAGRVKLGFYSPPDCEPGAAAVAVEWRRRRAADRISTG